VLILSEARYRCTSCGDCCRGWDVPLQEGEAMRVRELGAQLVPAVRLGRGRHGGVTVDTLPAKPACALLTDEQLCRIHARFGEAQKPRACRIFPYTFVATPAGVRVGLSWSCPAVVDGEGVPLSEQRAEISAVFKEAVEGTRYLLQVGEWNEALLAALPSAGTFVEKLAHAGAVCALAQDGLDAAQAPSLVREALAAPIAVDRLSRAMFRALLGAAEGQASMGSRLLRLFGGGRIQLRGAAVSPSEVEQVRRGLDAESDALLGRWLDAALFGLTFFGDAAFGLSIAEGLDLLALSAAVTVYLSRAYAAAGGRSQATLADVRAAVRQVDAGLAHRSTMPSGFARALGATASLDLLREQLQPGTQPAL
jgi:lysine-N-methylase